jgi:hypothetical protein
VSFHEGIACSSQTPVEVLSGTVERGLHWVVVASGDQVDLDLSTMLHVYRGGQQVAGSGSAVQACTQAR